LNKGNWNNKQIVPEAWVHSSTEQTNSAHYGFLWWHDTFEGRPIFFAQGLGGQHIVIVPDLDLVVITTSYMPRHNSALGFIKLVLLPCIQRTDERKGELPPANQIIVRFIETIGGRENLAKLKSLRTAGSADVEAMGIHGTFEQLKGANNRIQSTVDWPAWPTERFGSDGQVVWTSYPAGYRILQDQQAEVWKLEASNWTDLRAAGKEMKTVGAVTFDGKPCYQLQVTTDSREVLTDYFDVETGLLAGSIRGEEWYPYGLQAVTRIFREYRAFDGFLWPTKILRHVQGPEVIFSRTLVEYDTANFAVFELPIAAQEIVKGRRANAR
jgi:hypothetical protein